jgi:hypothetical protein
MLPLWSVCLVLQVVAIVYMFYFTANGGVHSWRYHIRKQVTRQIRKQTRFITRKRVEWRARSISQGVSSWGSCLKSLVQHMTQPLFISILWILQHLPPFFIILWVWRHSPFTSRNRQQRRLTGTKEAINLQRSTRVRQALNRHRIVRSSAWTKLFAVSTMLLAAATAQPTTTAAMISALPTVLTASTEGNTAEHNQQFDSNSKALGHDSRASACISDVLTDFPFNDL